ncbi:MAG: FAD-dependent oxidoreductase [Kofleriaceae bacterium]|nr:FAD-dependent oxidoreductase [Kofleriaceae bacterium]
MFPTLTDAQIARVSTCAIECRFGEHDVLYEPGDLDLPMYVVLEGVIEIIHPHERVEDAIALIGPREFTGEVNLLSDGRALVRARARTPVRAFKIEHARLHTLIQNDSELSDVLLRAFLLRRVALIETGQGDAIVIGSQSSAATTRLLAFLVQNIHPHRYLDVDRDPDVERLLGHFGVGIDDIPVLICRGERVLRHPSDAEAADCLGFNPTLAPETVHDLVICGAGPAGLASAVYAASEGLDVVIVESYAPGGQAATSSKIENYLGFPTGIAGGKLMASALAQAEKFGARLLVAKTVERLAAEERSYRLVLSGGASLRARTVILATGVEYRKLDVPGREQFEGVGIYYAATQVEAQRCPNDDVVVIGGANSAGQAASFLARTCRQVHMLVRGPNLSEHMSRYLVRRLEDTPNIFIHTRSRVTAFEGNHHLESITWHDDTTGADTRLSCRNVFSMAGADPQTDWLRDFVHVDPRGFIVTGPELSAADLVAAGWPRQRRPYLLETSRPGIFAVGDVRAAKIKRVASAVGEGSVCVQLVQQTLTE